MKMLRRNPPPAAPPAAADPAAGTVTRRRVEVTVEREWARATVTGSATQPARVEAPCEICGCRMLMVSPTTAAVMAGVTIRTIYRWVDEERVHFFESATGDLYLCAQSIPAPDQPQAVPNKTLSPGDSR
jgi:hypothetical protein